MQECPLPSCAFQPTLVADLVAKGGNPWENTDEISKHRPSRFKANSSGGFVAQKKKYAVERKSKSNWVIYQHQQCRAHKLDIHSGKKEWINRFVERGKPNVSRSSESSLLRAGLCWNGGYLRKWRQISREALSLSCLPRHTWQILPEKQIFLDLLQIVRQVKTNLNINDKMIRVSGWLFYFCWRESILIISSQ